MFSGPPRRRARIASRVAIAILALAGLLVAAEVGLRAAGAMDPWERFELRAGLNDGARYLAPDELVPGGWRTQVYGDGARETHIPPRDARARIVILGGSNASSLETPVLAAALDAAEPGRGHEVVNLGRAGYGAERCLIYLRQVLPTLKPDVVVISVGQQEFLEPGLGADLADSGGPTKADELRLAGWLESCGRVAPCDVPWKGGPDPEPVGEWSAEDAALTPEECEAIYETFGRHLQEMVDATRKAGVRLVLCTSASNLLVPPSLPGHRQTLSVAEQSQFDKARETAHRAFPPRLVAGLIRTAADRPPLHMSLPLWGLPARPNGPTPKKPSRGNDAPELRQLGFPYQEGVFWGDPEYWDPRVHILMDTVHDFHERQLTPEERAAVDLAVEAEQKAVDISPGQAYAVFELGLALYLQGNAAEGVARLREAQTLDLHPNRGNDRTNSMIRAAAQAQDVALADVDAMLRAASPDGLVGYELLADACHLHPAARRQVLDVLVPAILKP